MYRKPTTTDILIHNRSCHPNEHKLASIYCCTQGLNTYTITENDKKEERNMIIKMLEATVYDVKLLNKTRDQNGKEEKKVQNLTENNNKNCYIYIF
jgi:hypothetical protein